MAYSLDILCAQLVNLGYQPGFFTEPEKADLSPFPGRSLKHVIWGQDPGFGKIAYGLVTTGPEGDIASIRGTQVPLNPDGSKNFMEWLRNFEALLVNCPFMSGAQVHDGICKDYLSLTIEDGTPVGKALAGSQSLTVSGHSKGGPLAMYLASEAGRIGGNQPACITFAPCKPGDKWFGRACIQFTRGVRSWANPKDLVPHSPLTITDLPPPFINEDYEFPTQLVPLKPAPGVVTHDFSEEHNLAGWYIPAIQAIA